MNISINILGTLLEAQVWSLDRVTGYQWLNRTGDVIRRNIDDLKLPPEPTWEITGSQIRTTNQVIVTDIDTNEEMDSFLIGDIDDQSNAEPFPLPKHEYYLIKVDFMKGGTEYRFKDVMSYSRDLLYFEGIGIGSDSGLGVTTSVRLGLDIQYPMDSYGRQVDWDYWVE